MFLLIIFHIFFSRCDFTQLCQSDGCIYRDIPFGGSSQLVKHQVRELNFHLTPVIDLKSNSISYEGLTFWKYNEVESVTFRFNAVDQLDGVFIYMKPDEKNVYPELLDLYLDVQEEIIKSGKYDSLEFQYKYKYPFGEGTQKEALDGDYTYQEMDALEQDGTQRLSVRRFGQVYSRFKSKTLPIELTLMISYVRYLQRPGGHFVVLLSFEDKSRSHILNSGF